MSVVVALRPGWARIAVTDAGAGAWKPPDAALDAVSEYGRGLFIVEQTADKVGHDITECGQTMWAEFTWGVES